MPIAIGLFNLWDREVLGLLIKLKILQTHANLALKELSLRRITNWKALELFEREAQILSQLNHPAIPKYLDYVQIDTPTDRYFYLAQELAPGKSLATLVEKNWHPTEVEIKQIATQILEVLNYLHQLIPPVIHRDIKPQNIIRCDDGQIFLVDFGAVTDTYRQTIMGGSTVVGTYGYMAPEQFRGQAFPGTDLYGLGATLIFLLTHRSLTDLPQQRLKVNFRSQVHISKDFAEWLEKIIEPMIEDRFASAAEALAFLRGDRVQIYPLTKRKKPSGSRIVITQARNRLAVTIPPGGLRADNLSLACVTIFWNLFVLFWTYLAITSGAPWIFPVFSIPFGLAGINILVGTCLRIASSNYLEIGPVSFRLQWRLFGLSWSVKGETQNIERIELNEDYNLNKHPVMICTLVEGVRSHRFGYMLTELEKEWLVEKLNSFLGKSIS